MKKVAIILLLGIYSVATMGVSLKQFYCCGKLKSISLSLAQEGKKKCSNGIEKSGCCENKYQFFKVKDNHLSADQASAPFNHSIDLHLYPTQFQYIIFATQKTTFANRSNAPPITAGVPLYIYNCIFRI